MVKRDEILLVIVMDFWGASAPKIQYFFPPESAGRETCLELLSYFCDVISNQTIDFCFNIGDHCVKGNGAA